MEEKNTNVNEEEIAGNTHPGTSNASTEETPPQPAIDPVAVINKYIGQSIAGVASSVLGTLNELASREGVTAAVKGLSYEQIVSLITKLNKELDEREEARKKM